MALVNISLTHSHSLSLFLLVALTHTRKKQESSSRQAAKQQINKKMICPFVAIGIQGFTSSFPFLTLSSSLLGERSKTLAATSKGKQHMHFAKIRPLYSMNHHFVSCALCRNRLVLLTRTHSHAETLP
jgi:hypothetical protein